VIEILFGNEFGVEVREFACVPDPAEPALLFLGFR
jgi:hypothetical protein